MARTYCVPARVASAHPIIALDSAVEFTARQASDGVQTPPASQWGHRRRGALIQRLRQWKQHTCTIPSPRGERETASGGLFLQRRVLILTATPCEPLHALV
jgi:hypothetical protein